MKIIKIIKIVIAITATVIVYALLCTFAHGTSLDGEI